MRIGFVNVFSFRPHVEHLYYLATTVAKDNHEVFFLTCDSAVSNCYSRAIKGKQKISECPKCILGGVRSFPVQNITSLTGKSGSLDEEILDELALSSSCTLNRTESEAEWNEPQVVAIRESLYEPIDKVYEGASRWIKDNKLEGVVCFNGRMDLTRAITYACEQMQIPYVTHERTWFGDGIHLIPNANCLSLRALSQMVKEYDNKPLTLTQAKLAGRLAGERFLQTNSLEWRLYNQNPEPAPWPLNSDGPKVLVIPSSKNEFAGHNEWRTDWEDNTKALDDLFEAFSIKPEQVVVRCHPNWAENIGQAVGDRSLSLYKEWTERNSIYCISSEQKASTYDLIQQADIVVLNGGSSAVEAGVCGKQVICMGPSTYQEAGFVRVFRDKQSLYASGALIPLDPDMVIRKTLRFLYLRSHRFPQYVEYVRALETTRYEYFEGADPERLISMLRTGKMVADDSSFSTDNRDEDEVVAALKNKEWKKLASHTVERIKLKPLPIQRRFGLRWVDNVRAKMPRGDRG
ncbi:capsule biosynthesis protein [Pseudomonas corrugata]|uniref:capsule biosynthesis protein n=1 Tax=Pseudomonas corrugata TaxID=47879 RepID=UPI0006D898DF|nr:capsule biosynthesis protein [Pseudomonas corrugata]AOE64666.1 capsule biosynthesis protein [Pseudomonas corrugata]